MQNTQKSPKTHNDQVNAQIEKLIDSGSGDYQTLMRQASKNRRLIELNEFQLYVSMSRAKFLMGVVGRGGGKTTARGDRWSKMLTDMPRSTGLFIGPSYQAILTRILPSLKQGLEMFGIYENLHYFIGKQPPRSWRNSWERAYQPPDKYDRYITFWNGVGVHLISHDLPSDGRGLNSDWADGDEAALLDPRKLQENTDPTIRGTNTREFKDSPFFGSKFYTTSMPLTPLGRWVLEYEMKCLENPSLYNYLSFPCLVNAANLRKGFLTEAGRDALYRWVFLAEYMNVAPKFTKNGFYPLLDQDKHTYENFDYGYYSERGKEIDCRGDGDLTAGQPLILGIDWGAAINSLVALQHIGKVMYALKSMYVLGDEGKVQSDLFKQFHEYYRHHQGSNKRIFLYYDNSGNNATGITKYTRAEMAKQQLTELGWQVTLKTIGGRNPEHSKKHILWNAILKEESNHLPIFRMNKHNCKDLWISMFNAQAVQSGGTDFKKDKSSERRTSTVQRQHATDLSDAIDSPIYSMFYRLFMQGGSSLRESIIR